MIRTSVPRPPPTTLTTLPPSSISRNGSCLVAWAAASHWQHANEGKGGGGGGLKKVMISICASVLQSVL